MAKNGLFCMFSSLFFKAIQAAAAKESLATAQATQGPRQGIASGSAALKENTCQENLQITRHKCARSVFIVKAVAVDKAEAFKEDLAKISRSPIQMNLSSKKSQPNPWSLYRIR